MTPMIIKAGKYLLPDCVYQHPVCTACLGYFKIYRERLASVVFFC